jgi:poly-gamma-glutamate synthase PgsB/CapB
MSWVLSLSVLLLVLLLLEAAVARRNVNGIPCRVLVTGTRGKSGLVRVLSAGLRTVEPATWGKITGDIASVVTPEGTLRRLARHGPAHLREQARLVRDCRRSRARCLVVESMAVTLEAMVAEARLLRPTLMIVTNVRDDHRETLGSDPCRQRAAYLSSIPSGCRWLTRDEELMDFARRSGRVSAPVPLPAGEAIPGNLQELDVAAELVATAEAAMITLGLDPKPARDAMRAAAAGLPPPPRVVTLLGRELILLDAFSANELESLARLWTQWRKDSGDASKWSVLLNTSADRPLRTREFCRWLAGRDDVDQIFLSGSHVPAAARFLRGCGRPVARVPRGEPIVTAEDRGAAARRGDLGHIVGIGNVSGLGLRLRAESGGDVRP